MTMKALQLHYTSCRNGESGAPGFQVRATTPGITDQEARECARLGAYKAPLDAPDQPDPDQIGAHYPVDLRWHRLESGRAVLLRSRYVGRDYSGRWGNYFAHALVLVDDQPPFWPLDYYEWAGWVDALDPEHDTREDVEDLDTVDLGEIVPSESFAFDDLAAFLTDIPDGVALLARMIRALFAGARDERALVVRDIRVNGVYWIACIQKALPIPHARQLTSSTYVYDPRRCADINATCGETGFRFDSTTRDFQFYVFDLDEGVYSETVDATGDYAETVARWMADRPRDLEAFHAYVGASSHRALEADELLSGLHLYAFVELGESIGDGPAIRAVIDFARRYTTPDVHRDLAIRCTALLGAAHAPLDAESSAAVIHFVAQTAVTSGDVTLIAHAIDAWSGLAAQILAGASGVEGCMQARTVLIEHDPGIDASLMDGVLATARAHAAAGRGAPSSIDALAFGLQMVGRAIRVTGGVPSEEAAFGAFLAETARSQGYGGATRAALAVAEGDPEYLGQFTLAVARIAGDDSARGAVGHALADHLRAVEPRVAVTVRAALDDPAHHAILLAEWAACVADGPPDALARHQRYMASARRHTPRFAQARAGEIARAIFDGGSPRQRAANAYRWLETADARAHAALAADCLRWIDQALSITQLAPMNDVEKIEGWRKTYGVRITPDRLALIRALAEAKSTESPLSAAHAQRVSSALVGLDPKTYTRFIGAYLPAALGAARGGAGHRRTLSALDGATHPAALRAAVEQFYAEASPTDYDVEGAIEYWVPMRLDGTEPVLGESRGRVTARLVKVAAAEPPSLLTRLSADYLYANTTADVAAYRRFVDAVERRRGGLWGRVKSLFGRGRRHGIE